MNTDALPYPPSAPSGKRQEATHDLLKKVGRAGLTWKDLAQMHDLHHGAASGVLSRMHAQGKVARLANMERDGSSVYVLPEYVLGRETQAPGRTTNLTSVTPHQCVTPEPEVRLVQVEVPGPERVVEVPVRLTLTFQQAGEVAAIRAWAEDKTKPWPGRPMLLRVLDLLAQTTQ